MQTAIRSIWMEELSRARTWGEAEAVVNQAIHAGNRTELLVFLAALYEEFIGPDTAGGGEAVTRERIKTIASVISPTDGELSTFGISPADFHSIVNHS